MEHVDHLRRGLASSLAALMVALAAPAGAQVQQGAAAPATGVLLLPNVPAAAKDAFFAATDARQQFQIASAFEQLNRALAADSTLSLARVTRARMAGTPPTELAAENRRAMADLSARNAAEMAYATGLRLPGANAIRFFAIARQLMPNDRRVALDHATSFPQAERQDSLRALVRRYPDWVAPRLQLVSSIVSLVSAVSPADLYEGLLVAEGAAQLAPTLSTSHAMLGYAHFRLGHADEAMAHLNAATKIDPRDAVAHTMKAEVIARSRTTGFVDRARASLDSANAALPSASGRVNNMRDKGILLFYDGRRKEGMAELTTVARDMETRGNAGGAGTIYSQMAGLAAGTGDTAEVSRLMAEARRAAPNANYTVQATQAYGLARKPVDARRELEAFIKGSADTTTTAFHSDRHRLTGMTLLAEGKAAEALAELKRSDLWANPFALLAMVDAYTMLNRKAEAAAAQAELLRDAKGTALNSVALAVANYRATKR